MAFQSFRNYFLCHCCVGGFILWLCYGNLDILAFHTNLKVVRGSFPKYIIDSRCYSFCCCFNTISEGLVHQLSDIKKKKDFLLWRVSWLPNAHWVLMSVTLFCHFEQGHSLACFTCSHVEDSEEQPETSEPQTLTQDQLSNSLGCPMQSDSKCPVLDSKSRHSRHQQQWKHCVGLCAEAWVGAPLKPALLFLSNKWSTPKCFSQSFLNPNAWGLSRVKC